MTTSLRRVTYLSLQAALGARVGRHCAEFAAVERSADRLHRLHDTRLRATLDAASRSRYYRERVELKRNLRLSDMPIVSRDELVAHFSDFVADPLADAVREGRRSGFYSWTKVTTGGSSGQPAAVVHGRGYRDRGRAARMYSQALCGFPFGTPYIRLWGSMRDINATGASLSSRLTDALSRVTVLNGFRQDAAALQRHIQVINAVTARHLMGYADAIYEVATYARNHGLALRALDSIMCCAGTVTPEMRSSIQTAFKASIRNKYGTRECAEIACECEAGMMHIYTNNVALEIVDTNGVPLPPGKRGRILVTLLDNPEFPLIRYDIGDVGVLGSHDCSCGRAFPTLEAVEGRVIEFITDAAGAPVSPVFIRHIVGVVHHRPWILRYRLTQKGQLYELLLQVDTVDSQSVDHFRNEIVPDLQAVLGREADIVVRVDNNPGDRDKWLCSLNLTGRTSLQPQVAPAQPGLQR